MSDARPNYTVCRCCKTCHYFKQDDNTSYEGSCILAQTTDPTAPPVLTNLIMTCDAHTWRASRKVIHRWAVKCGARIPDDIL